MAMPAFKLSSILPRTEDPSQRTVIPLHEREYHFEDDTPHDPLTEPLPQSLDEMELVIRRLQNDNVDVDGTIEKLNLQRAANDELLRRFRTAFAKRALDAGVHSSMASEELE